MRDRALTFTLAVLALLLFCGLFVERKTEQKVSMASTVDIGEQGLAAAFHWLQRRGVPLSSWRKPWNELAESHPQGNVLLSVLPFRAQEEKTGNWRDSPGSYISPRETQELINWVAAGNTYVMAINAFDAAGNSPNSRASERQAASYFDFLELIGWELEGTAINSWINVDDDAESSAENDSTGKDTEALPSVSAGPQALHKLQLQLTADQAPINFETRAWEVQGSTELALSPLAVEADCKGQDEIFEDGDAEVDLAPVTTKIRQEAAVNVENENEKADAVQRCMAMGLKQAVVIMRSADEVPVAWWLPFGRGGVVVLGYGSVWRNPNLNQPGSALALETMLRFYLQTGAEVLVDDGHYGLSSIYDPAALLKDARLYMTLSIAGVFWLLYAVGRSRRLLPLRSAKIRTSSATFARAITDFYARQLSEKELAEALIAHFLRHVRRALGLRNASEDELWQRLQNESRLAIEDIDEIRALRAGIDNVKLGQVLLRQHARLMR